MDASWKNSLEEELLCPICLHVFDEPVQLPCKHNFCKGCISDAWAKDNAAVCCPECNHEYNQKPALEKNFKLASIAKLFDSLNTERAPAVLQCAHCRRGPKLPVQKVCLRCKEACCEAHVQTHLQQPCENLAHLLVDAEQLTAWTCPIHEEYRVLYCGEDHVALCNFCCISHCVGQKHTICHVDLERKVLQSQLMLQQGLLNSRVQNIDEKLTTLEADKTQMRDAVSKMKERVRAQYQRMHKLLEEGQYDTMQSLDNTCTKHVMAQSQQALELNERRQEAKKLASSLETFLEKTENINVMKNAKPFHMLIARSNSYLTRAVPLFIVGKLNSEYLISDLHVKEKNLQQMLREPLNQSAIVWTVQSRGSAGSQVGTSPAPKKRKYVNFMESKTENSTSQNPQSRARLLDSPAHHNVGLGSGLSHHSGTPDFTIGGVSQQAMYDGRKVLMRGPNNSCCSREPSARAGPPYPPPGYVRPSTSQGFPYPLPESQPLQHFPIVL